MTTIHDQLCPYCGEPMESDTWSAPDEPEYIGCSRCNYWREVVEDDGDDGLLTCSVCRDRYTTNRNGVCDHCKHQEWLDKNA